MKNILLVIVAAITIAVTSSVATFFLLKSGFFSYPAFAVGNEGQKPTAFANLIVIDNSRDALTYAEQESLFKGLGEQLHDPLSAQVKGLTRSQSGMVCGYLNAKNSFGGYVGFSPFVAMPSGDVVVAPHEIASDPVVKQIAAMCVN